VGLFIFSVGPCSNKEWVCITFADILPRPRPLPLPRSPESRPLPLPPEFGRLPSLDFGVDADAESLALLKQKEIIVYIIYWTDFCSKNNIQNILVLPLMNLKTKLQNFVKIK
jgi:hypothetical protein